MSGLKVAVIGGGSSYTPELVEGFITRSADLPLTDLRLVDVPAGKEKVEIIAALTRRQLDKAGMAVDAGVTMHLEQTLPGEIPVIAEEA